MKPFTSCNLMMKTKIVLKLPQSLDTRMDEKNSRRDDKKGLVGWEKPPLPNAWRDKELVNPPHPQILAPQKLTTFFQGELASLIIELSLN